MSFLLLILRTALLQKLLDMLLLMNEKPITKETREKAAQTDFEVVAAAPANKPSPSLSVKDPAPAFVPPPPPPSAPPFVLTSLPPPPLPDSFMSGPQKPKFEGLSALLDKIPKPKNTTRRLQWKKLTEIVLSESNFCGGNAEKILLNN